MLQSQTNIQMQQILNLIYPVGSLYFSTTMSTKEQVQATLGGTWEKLPEGYAIWTASSGAGGTIAAGLPNIKGTLSGFDQGNGTGTYAEGALDYQYNSDWKSGTIHKPGSKIGIKFDASKSNTIYRDNVTTVQPPAYKVYAYRRIP